MIRKVFIFVSITLFMFLLLYYPPIIGINTLHLLALFSYFYLFTKKYIRKKIVRIIKEFSIPVILILIVLFLNSVLIWNNPTIDIGLFVMAFETIPITIVISKIKTEKLSEYCFIDMLIIVALIQASIAFFAFLIPSFHSLIIGKYLSYGFNDIIGKMAGWRMYGYSYTMAYAMPIVQAIIASISIYKGMKAGCRYFVAAIVIFLSAIINARVSIVIFFIGSMGAILFANRVNVKNILKILAILVMSLFILEKGFTYLANSESDTSIWITNGIEDIKAFFTGDSLAQDSYFAYATNDDKYRLPDSIGGIIFGTGNITTRGNMDFQSDVGYINDIWYCGLIYVILIFYFYISKLMKLFIFLNKNYNVSYLLFYVALIILLASNIKGRCFSWNEITQLLVMCFIYYRYAQLSNTYLNGGKY